jgi:multidrug efflux pump subunit AcrA (membrane-fusion protein)
MQTQTRSPGSERMPSPPASWHVPEHFGEPSIQTVLSGSNGADVLIKFSSNDLPRFGNRDHWAQLDPLIRQDAAGLKELRDFHSLRIELEQVRNKAIAAAAEVTELQARYKRLTLTAEPGLGKKLAALQREISQAQARASEAQDTAAGAGETLTAMLDRARHNAVVRVRELVRKHATAARTAMKARRQALIDEIVRKIDPELSELPGLEYTLRFGFAGNTFDGEIEELVDEIRPEQPTAIEPASAA